MFRNKNIQCCIWPNIISWRPVEDWIRVAYYSKGPIRITLRTSSSTSTTLPSVRPSTPTERQRLARAIGDHLFDEFADMPLIWFYNEVVVNPKVVADWQYPGLGAGRSTHFHLLKAVK